MKTYQSAQILLFGRSKSFSIKRYTEDWPLPQTSLTAPIVENIDTPVNISENDSMDPPRLDGPSSPPPHTLAVFSSGATTPDTP